MTTPTDPNPFRDADRDALVNMGHAFPMTAARADFADAFADYLIAKREVVLRALGAYEETVVPLDGNEREANDA